MMIPEQTHLTATCVPTFAERALAASPRANVPERMGTLMLNVGLRCIAACAHCHHGCTPERTEVMSRETMLDAITLAERIRPDLVDITGGEPELFAPLPELIARLRAAGIAVRVRTNLVALARPENVALPELFADAGVRLLASLPGTSAVAIEAQRGSAWWETALGVLLRLNALGYGGGAGADGSIGSGADARAGVGEGMSAGVGLGAQGARLESERRILELAYNPPLGEICRSQVELEAEFRTALSALGVRFDSLLAIANVPVGRLRSRLLADNAYVAYIARLASRFSHDVVEPMGCRHGIEIAWDGSVWDCDFNLAAGMRPTAGPRTVADLLSAHGLAARTPRAHGGDVDGDGAADLEAALATRRIGFGAHCYACTAAAGSSRAGALS